MYKRQLLTIGALCTGLSFGQVLAGDEMCIRDREEEVDRIDQYVEQALYYTRSTVVEKDYVIRRCSLDQIVSQVIKNHAKTLISRQFSIERENLDQTVYTDEMCIRDRSTVDAFHRSIKRFEVDRQNHALFLHCQAPFQPPSGLSLIHISS